MIAKSHILFDLGCSKAKVKAEALLEEVMAVSAKKLVEVEAEAMPVVSMTVVEVVPVVAEEEAELVLPIEGVHVDSPISRVHCFSLIPQTDPYSPCFSYQRSTCSLASSAYCFGHSFSLDFTKLLACSTRTTPTSFLPHDASSSPPLTTDPNAALTSFLDWDAFVPLSPSSKFSWTP